MKEVTITFTKTYRTDDSDPILAKDDYQVVDWFVGTTNRINLEAEGFGLEVLR